ncbi:MAG TPA: serine/threonine-protein kinase [Opitutaceae bacterium]|nr:serine/threonine-protein kinase [Opitutaceae bacterium]
MGVVYRARDLNTERIIALKVLQAHHLEVPDLVQRFRSEVRAVSSLDHPHVLPIHEVGEHDGIPFFSMKLTTGQSLAHRIGNFLGKPREAAQLLAKVARGVQHAHERGILHRDLKPGNILLDAAGEPFVCDFGLAKWLDDDKKLTMTAAVLGTPHYIAPEQASGSKALTTAVDIYSLGAILYELLTGRPPFVGGTVLETLLASQDHAPERPSSIARNVPRDLETICLKALQREPATRYPTAAAFADDLENWLAGRPINARPVSAGEQLWRWAKRNPLPAALASSLLLVLVVTAIGALYSAERLRASLTRAVDAEAAAKERLYQSLVAQARATRRTGTAGQRYLAMEALEQAAAVRKDPELRAEVIAALSLYDLQVEARWKVRENALKQPIRFNGSLTKLYVADLNGNVEVQSVTTHHVIEKLTGTASPILALAASGHAFVAARCEGNQVLVWRQGNSTPVLHLQNHPMTSRGSRWVYDFTFSLNDKYFAVTTADNRIEIYNTETWSVVRDLQRTPQQNILCFSRDGRNLAVAGPTESEIEIYPIEANNAAPSVLKMPAAVQHLDWSPDSEQLAVGCSDFNVYLIDARTGKRYRTFSGHKQDITQVRFGHTGTILATTARDDTTRVWDCRSSENQVVLSGLGGENSLEFSENDTTLSSTDWISDVALLHVYGNERACIEADAPIARDFATLTASLDCSSDSETFATASYRGIFLYRTKDLKLLGTLFTNETEPIDPLNDEKSVNFRRNKAELIIADRRRSPAYYSIKTTGPAKDQTIEFVRPLQLGTGYVLGSIPSYQSDYICLTNRSDRTGVVYDLKTDAPRFTVAHQDFIWDMVASKDGSWSATAYSGQGPDDSLIWKRSAETAVAKLKSGASGLLTMSPSEDELITTGYEGALVWKTRDWTLGAALKAKTMGSDVACAVYAHHRPTLAISTSHNVILFSGPEHREVTAIDTKMNNARLIFDQADKLLIAQGTDNSVCIWRLDFIHRELSKLGLDWE